MGRYSDACNYAVPLALTDRILAVISVQEFQKKSDQLPPTKVGGLGRETQGKS